jgi:hypothetical protein
MTAWAGFVSRVVWEPMRILHFANVALSKVVATANRLLKPTYVPTMFNGAVVRVPREIWQSLYGRYEEYNAQPLREHLKPGDFFVDIGFRHEVLFPNPYSLYTVLATRR